MKSIVRYHLAAIFGALSFYVWLAAAFFAGIAASQIRWDVLEASPLSVPLVRTQILVGLMWAFVTIQGGGWAVFFAHERRVSGLSVWWHSRGISAWKQWGALLASTVAASAVYILVLMAGLVWACSGIRPLPWELVVEQAALLVLAALLYQGVCLILGSWLDRTAALLAALTLFVFSIAGHMALYRFVSGLPQPWNATASVLILALPNFDLFYRPGALIHFWPPLKLWVWAGLGVYTGVWLGILILAARRAFKPWFT